MLCLEWSSRELLDFFFVTISNIDQKQTLMMLERYMVSSYLLYDEYSVYVFANHQGFCYTTRLQI